EVMLHTDVRELLGEGALRAVVVEDNHSGERRTLDARSLFVFIGAEPYARWLGDRLALDPDGFILTGTAASNGPAPDGRGPKLLETSCPGVFAVGDVRSGSVRRVASAVGEGAMAVRVVHEHLERFGGSNVLEAQTNASST